MALTTKVSSRLNLKQPTGADFPLIPAQIVTEMYGPVASTSGQTTINLGFSVSQSNLANFILIYNGQILSEGASNDYIFTNIASNNTSSTISLNFALSAGLNIQAIYFGIAQPPLAATSLNTTTALATSGLALATKNHAINSAFDWWQVGVSGTIANGVSAYQADQWYVKNSLGTNGVITCSQVAGSLQGSLYGCSVQISTAPTASQANGCELYQVLENRASIELYGQTACCTANVKALGNVTQIGIQFFYSTSEVKLATAIGTEQTFNVNSSGFTLCQALNQALGTAQTTSGVVGVRIRPVAVSTGNLYDLNNGFVVEQVMLNTGTTAGTYARAGRTVDEELSSCQRFYWTDSWVAAGQTQNTSVIQMTNDVRFSVKMRVVPALTHSALTWTNAGAGIFDNGQSYNSTLTETATRFSISISNVNGRAANINGSIAGNTIADARI